MHADVMAALVGAIGGLVTGVVAAIVTLRAKGIDRIVEDRKLWVDAYDTRLLEQRLVEYKKLWRLTEFSSQRHIEKLDGPDAEDLAERMVSWYYTDGGMLMSATCRDAFFAARDALAEFHDNATSRSHVVGTFSALRTALCNDMNSRAGPTLVPQSPE